MRKIKKDDYVLSISHGDGDGVAAQIVLANVFPNIKFKNTSFVKIDDILRLYNFSPFKHVFITDIYPDNHALMEKSDKFILLDHHDTSLPLHDISKMRFVDTKYCAAHLTKRFVETYFGQKLPHLDKYIWHINDYDLWQHKDPFSKELNIVYEMYKGDFNNPTQYRKRFMSGDITLTKEERDYIDYRRKEYKQMYNEMELIEFEHINGAFVTNVASFVNEVCDDLMKNNGYQMVAIRNLKTGHTGIRHKVDSMHMGNILTELNYGGGHKHAAGIQGTDVKETIRKILHLERVLYERFPEIRKKT